MQVHSWRGYAGVLDCYRYRGLGWLLVWFLDSRGLGGERAWWDIGS